MRSVIAVRLLSGRRPQTSRGLDQTTAPAALVGRLGRISALRGGNWLVHPTGTDRGRESVAAALDTIATIEGELEDVLGPEKVAELHDSLSRILTTSRPSTDAR